MPRSAVFSMPILLIFIPFIMLGRLSGGMSCSDWCIASEEATDKVVQKALDWVCLYGSACERIKEGQPCYKPNDLRAVASVAFNQYWQKVKPNASPCDHLFGATTLVHSDPSRENCTIPCI